MAQDYNFPNEDGMKREEHQVLKRFGRQVRYYRRLKNLTQEQLGEQAQVSYKYIGEIERGRKKASIIVIFRLAHALQISMSDMVSLSKEQGDANLMCLRSIIHHLENRDLADLKKALNLLKLCLQNN
jgi:transcriptional regulator with XRE-family HTH domain